MFVSLRVPFLGVVFFDWGEDGSVGLQLLSPLVSSPSHCSSLQSQLLDITKGSWRWGYKDAKLGCSSESGGLSYLPVSPGCIWASKKDITVNS